MAVILPYRFDTSATAKQIVKVGVCFEAVMVLGIAYAVAISHDMGVALGFGFTAVFIWGIGAAGLRVAQCSVGTLDRDKVIVAPARAGFGLKFPGPSGTFALRQFAAVRCKPMLSKPWVKPAALLSLIGRPGVPDIVFARVDGDGIATGQECAATLGLPFEDARTWLTAKPAAGETERAGAVQITFAKNDALAVAPAAIRAALRGPQAILGALFLGAAFYIGHQQIDLLLDGARVSGHVVAYQRLTSASGNQHNIKHPLVEFPANGGGHTVRFLDRIGPGGGGAVGAVVSVLYMPHQPTLAMIDRPVRNWFPWGLLAIVGILTILSALRGWLRDRVLT